jgi:hypothetical protein
MPGATRYAVALLLLGAFSASISAQTSRKDFFAKGSGGSRIHVREVRDRGACDPILLVHGARVPGVASFDLPVAGGSLAADLAAQGFCA